MTTSKRRCYLLELPRELRDQIYGYIHKKCEITNDSEKFEDLCARVRMMNGPEPQILRVCKQIYQEYAEIAFKRPQLLFNVKTVPWQTANLHTKSAFALHAMREAVSCTLTVSYTDLLEYTGQERLVEWARETRNEPEHETLQRTWTPSTEATRILTDMLNNLSTVLNETCKVIVLIICDGTSDHIELLTRGKVLHAPTYRALTENSRVPFVQKSGLGLFFQLVTSQYDRVVPADEAYDEDGRLADSSYTIRTRDNTVKFVTARSRDPVLWDLFPCGEQDPRLPTWCGFYPLRGVVLYEQ